MMMMMIGSVNRIETGNCVNPGISKRLESIQM